jgi:hypothetical protein
MNTKGMTISRAKRLLQIKDEKLDIYLKYYSGDVLSEPDPENPNLKWLTAQQKEQLERYRRIFAMFKVGRTDEDIRSIIMEEFNVELRQAYNLLSESYVLFGITDVADREGKKRASISFYRYLAHLSYKDKAWETAGKLWEKADKMEGLFEHEIEGLNPEDFKAIPKLVFVNSMKVYTNKQKELDLDL